MDAIPEWQYTYHRDFTGEARLTGLSTAAATFLILDALIVIGAASLCLTLPGVNVLRDVVIRGYIPGGLALLLALPCMVLSLSHAPTKSRLWAEWAEQIDAKVQDCTNEDEKEYGKAIAALFPKTWNFELKKKILSDLAKKHESDKHLQGAIGKALQSMIKS